MRIFACVAAVVGIWIVWLVALSPLSPRNTRSPDRIAGRWTGLCMLGLSALSLFAVRPSGNFPPGALAGWLVVMAYFGGVGGVLRAWRSLDEAWI